MKFGKRAAQSGAKRSLVLVASVLVLLLAVAGGTMAWLIANTGPVVNSFTPAHVSCEVTENFDGAIKRNVNVTNTGDIDAYIRVKLVTYRVNAQGRHIGGPATIPPFTPGANWVEHDGYYYYTKPVAPGQTPETNLIDTITLSSPYTDADGGKQVVEVMAEAIQSSPAEAVGGSWGVTISENNVAPYTASN